MNQRYNKAFKTHCVSIALVFLATCITITLAFSLSQQHYQPSYSANIAPEIATAATDIMLKSNCHCGQASLSVSTKDLRPPPEQAVDCYCRSCRRYHVAAFASFVLAPTSKVEVQGPTSTYRDICTQVGIVDRVYCTNCYTKLATKPRASANYMDTTLINMGPLVDKSIPKSMLQSWKQQRTPWNVGDKAAWIDALPKVSESQGAENSNRDVDIATTAGQQLRRNDLVLRGGCACGSARYSIDFTATATDGGTELQNCYCRLCRQMTGSAYQTWLPVDNADWEWNGRPQLVRTTDHGQRHICTSCGGVLTIVYDDQPGCTWPAAGSLDTSASFPSTQEEMEHCLYRVCHICCNYKQSWYELPQDGLERIEEAS